jgi:hypothetical protein
MHGAAQKACEPGENCGAKLLHRDESVPVSHLDCAAVSLFFILFSFCFDFFPFFFPFLTYRTTEQGWGDLEAATRQVCTQCGGWMSSGIETRVTRKDGTKGRKHK